jgi:hypothetical protein
MITEKNRDKTKPSRINAPICLIVLLPRINAAKAKLRRARKPTILSIKTEAKLCDLEPDLTPT